MTQQELLDGLKKDLEQLIATARHYKSLSPETLNKRPASGGWTVLECFEHMNRYDDFYTTALNTALDKATDQGTDERMFHSGMLGGRSANSMLPKEKMNKMKTFKKMNPKGEALEVEVIDTYIRHQRSYLDTIRTARRKNLNNVKVKLTIPILRFNAGDTFRFIVNHGIRHMAQIKGILENVR